MLTAFLAVDARAQDATELARAGIAAIGDRRFGDALAAFNRAAVLQPADASACFGAGVAAFMLGQNAVAQSRFECALALSPRHVQAALWLADLHYRAGRLPEAISICETALRHAPRDRELQDRLAHWRKEQALQSRFQSVRTDHFTVVFEAAAGETLAREVLERLEAAYSRVGNTLGVYPAQSITAVIYSREQFDEITQLGDWSAAAYDGRIRVPFGDAQVERDELDRVLSHEFVHALVGIIGGRTVPAWLNEGLATVLEPAWTLDVTAATERTNRRPGLSKLHDSFVGLSRPDAEIAYASAARAVQRLIDQKGTAAIVTMLEDLLRGAPLASAFQARTGMRYEDFQQSLITNH